MKYYPRFIVPMLIFLIFPTLVFGQFDMSNCTISTRATEDVSVLICPACDGNPFSAARTLTGIMDATIEVYIIDSQGQPIVHFPREGIWLDDPNLCFCPGVHPADHATDSNGYTQFALPVCGGGCSENLTLGGFLEGTPFNQNPLPHIRVNSPDLNCDLIVNLTDLQLFTAAYFGEYSYCVDFFWDGVMNLKDIPEFARHYGCSCP